MPQLTAGAAQVDITPLLGTELSGYFTKRHTNDIHDPLHAKAIVLDDGQAPIALCVCDLIVLPQGDCDRAKARAAELTGLHPQRIMVSCTHTHTGPATCGLLGADRQEEYCDWAARKIGDAIKLAHNRRQPAKLGWAVGSCPSQVHNRRHHLKDGRTVMNPGHLNPDDLGPAGPVDPDVGVVAIVDERQAGSLRDEPLAVLANYALHYVGGGTGLEVSADYFACFGRALQQMVGRDFVAIMANGCCGDVNNIDTTRPAPQQLHPYHQMERVARIVAAEVLKTWQEKITYCGEVELGCAYEVLPVRRKTVPPEQLEADRQTLAAGGEYASWDQTYARERLLVNELPEMLDAPIHAFSVKTTDGALGIATLPGEVFVEHGLAVKQRSPLQPTFVVELANGYLGYVPTAKAFTEGSYETETARSSLPASGEGERMVDTAVRMLGSL